MRLPSFLQLAVHIRLLLLTIPSVKGAANSTCYFPNGVESSGSPCNPDAAVSACCGPGFICLSNGLCSPGPDDRKSYQYKYYRSSCTDATWTNQSCPLYCLSSDDNLNAGQGLSSCSGSAGSFCCGRGYDCCQNSTDIFTLGAGNIETTIPYTDSSTAASSSNTGSASSSSSRKHKDQSLAIGLGVGLGIAGLFAIVAGVWFFLRHRSRKRKQIYMGPHELSSVKPVDQQTMSDAPEGPSTPAPHYSTHFAPPKPPAPPAELDNNPMRHEMEETHRYELDSDPYSNKVAKK